MINDTSKGMERVKASSLSYLVDGSVLYTDEGRSKLR